MRATYAYVPSEQYSINASCKYADIHLVLAQSCLVPRVSSPDGQYYPSFGLFEFLMLPLGLNAIRTRRSLVTWRHPDGAQTHTTAFTKNVLFYTSKSYVDSQGPLIGASFKMMQGKGATYALS